VHKIILSSGKAFTANEGETLLDAGMRSGLSLPYSCRTGRCSTCRTRVIAGQTLALHDETGLGPKERASGWVLGCVRTATSDIELDLEDLGDVRLFSARTLACRVQSLERLAPDVLRVTLRLPPTAEFGYLPGQYIDVIGAGGVRRSYSIANAPALDKCLELHIREVDGGAMSAYWFGSAKVNDLLRLHGPLGTFFARDIADLDLVFLATGTGIAPVKAMLEGIATWDAQAVPRSVTVYWGGRLPRDLYWKPEVPGLALRFVPVLSRAEAAWEGRRGHVQEALLADDPDLFRTALYACGSDTMIHDAQARLIAAGLPTRRFSSDAFVCSAAV
jgi:CDP-4-dehydro-6-deoxyglucose reductase